MLELESPFYGKPDLCQVASRVGWDFMRLSRGETGTTPAAEVAKRALDLCRAVEVARALVGGKDVQDATAFETIPATRRRMLMAERTTAGHDASRYEVIADCASRHKPLLESIALGKRHPDHEQLELLRRHFASVSLVLAEASL